MKYRKEIDGLRALAVIPVILCHGDFTAFSGGYIGVDIFFVISGYLITTIIVTEREGGFFSLLNFYERRARRILPALFFMMFCTLPFAMFWLLPTDLYLFSESLVAVPLFASNILFYLTSGYFDTAAELKPLLHTWSLAVEEQYYLLYPLLLLSVWGLGKRWIFSLILIAAVISLLFAHSVYLTHPTFTFFLLPTRAFELLIGGLLAFYLHPDRHPILINQSVSQTLSMVGFLLIIYAIVRFDKGTPTTLFYTPVPIVGASLIIIFANNKNLVGQLLSSKMLVQTGLISYSAYLWHQPLFAFAKIRTLDELSVLKLTLLSLISLLFGYLSWKYIEKPFRNKVLITSKTIIICTLLLSSFFIIIGLVGYVNKGFPSRISNEIKDVIYNPQAPLSNQACLNKYPEFKMFTACLLSKNEDPEVVLLGDSHSQHYFKSLSAALNQKSVINLAAWSCLPFSGDKQPSDCGRKIDTVLRFITDTDSIKVVILAGYWSYLATTEFEIENRNYRLPSRLKKINSEIFLDTGLKVLDELKRSGRRIIFMKDIPDLDFNIQSCFDMTPYKTGSIRTNCSMSYSNYMNRYKDFETLLSNLTVQYTSLEIYSPVELFCSNVSNECKAKDSFEPLYFNSDHLTIKGSDLVIQDLLMHYPIN